MDQVTSSAFTNTQPVREASPAWGLFLGAIALGLAMAVAAVAGFYLLAQKKTPDYSGSLNTIASNLAKSAVQEDKTQNPKLDDALFGYQAIFLTNGQVYFGKYKPYNSDYAVLSDIYYLQNGSNLQNTEPSGSMQREALQISLVKLGNELHGPQDAMYLPKSSVLFVENLKTDSQIVKAIQAYKSNGR